MKGRGLVLLGAAGFFVTAFVVQVFSVMQGHQLETLVSGSVVLVFYLELSVLSSGKGSFVFSFDACLELPQLVSGSD